VKQTRIAITVWGEDRTVLLDSPVGLPLAAAALGLLLEQPCGAAGTCGKCRVRVVTGQLPPSEADYRVLEPEEVEAGWRLGCQTVFESDATVEIPPSARSAIDKSFGDDSILPRDAVPVFRFNTVSLPTRSASDLRDDMERLGALLGLPSRALHAPPAVIRKLQGLARQQAPLRAVRRNHGLVSVGGSTGAPVGIALDIGSTTLAAAVVALDSGRVLTSGSSLNPQVALGTDVMSRIHHATDPEGFQRLVAALREGIDSLLHDIVARAGCVADDIVGVACAGNPTMLHFWVGAEVETLGRAPYTGSWSHALVCEGADVGLSSLPEAEVYTFPAVASHVGADAVAGAVACGLDISPYPTLYIDLGTNSELLLSCGGRVVATSAAAGPAFEGASIHHGMRAEAGAIDMVVIGSDGRLRCNVIGGSLPRGICGSGLIDAVAELLDAGMVRSDGRLASAEDASGLSLDLHRRLVGIGRERAVVLEWSATDATNEPGIMLTANDIRQLQLAKASIRAAAVILCAHLGLAPESLASIVVAGAFGSFLRKESAVAIGLFPQVESERIRLAGNAAGVGARLALVDARVRDRASALAARAEYVDLARHERYTEEFMGSLAFPDSASKARERF
jgi:uncharacterized 2Fe-2S/4Fe-4S cluster protein (DUF4445 family)